MFSPPYSPDFTPIELAFSKLKPFLRTTQARTRETLTAALRAALQWICEDDPKTGCTTVAIVYSNSETALELISLRTLPLAASSDT